MKANKSIRHGEILLYPVKDKAKGNTTEHDLFIVGHSETGHHHVLASEQKFEVTVDKEHLYLRLFAPGKLVHKKIVNRHHDLEVPTLPAGWTYKVIRKTEYDPFQKVRREVWD